MKFFKVFALTQCFSAVKNRIFFIFFRKNLKKNHFYKGKSLFFGQKIFFLNFMQKFFKKIFHLKKVHNSQIFQNFKFCAEKHLRNRKITPGKKVKSSFIPLKMRIKRFWPHFWIFRNYKKNKKKIYKKWFFDKKNFFLQKLNF